MDDDAGGTIPIPEDGRAPFPAYLPELKASADSKGPLDHRRVLSTLPGSEAAKPLKDGGCPLVKT